MWPSRRVRAQNHVPLPIDTSSQHYLVHRRYCTRAVIVTMSSSVFGSPLYHEYHEENHHKAEDDVDDFAIRQARVMFHLRGRKRKDERSTDCATFRTTLIDETGQWAGMLLSDKERSREVESIYPVRVLRVFALRKL